MTTRNLFAHFRSQDGSAFHLKNRKVCLQAPPRQDGNNILTPDPIIISVSDSGECSQNIVVPFTGRMTAHFVSFDEEVTIPAGDPLNLEVLIFHISIPAAPGALTLTALTDGSGHVDVTIPTVTGAQSYKLERKAGSGGTWVEIAAGLTVFPYHDTTTDFSTIYYYRGRASNAAGDSTYSAEANVTSASIPAPDVPLQLALTASGLDIHVTSNPTNAVQQYEIWRGGSSGAETLLHTATVVSGAALDYHDTSGVVGTTYFFKLKAKNTTGTSAFSNELSIATSYSSVDPATVSGRIVGYDSDAWTGATATDATGGGNNATQATGGLQPTVLSADINGHNSIQFDHASNSRQALTTPLTNVKAGILVLKCDQPDSGADTPAILGDATGFDFAGMTGTLLIDNANSAATLRSGTIAVNNFTDTPTNIQKPADWRVISFKTAGGSLKVGIIANDRNTSSRTLGARFAKIELFSAIPSNGDFFGMGVFMMNRYNITGTKVLRRQIVSVGDSQSSGSGWQIRTINCLAGNCASPVPILDTDWYNSTHAITGYTLDDMSAFDSAVAAEFNANRINQIVIIWGGTNDFYFGATAATAYSRLLARVAAYKAAGYTNILVVNCLPRNNAGTPGTYETERLSFNAMLVANAVAQGWKVSDIAAITNLQNPSDLTFFSDGVHLTGTGQDQMSPVVSADILTF